MRFLCFSFPFFCITFRFALPYPRIFLAVVHGIDEGILLSGSAVWLSTSAYSHFAAVCSQRTAGAVRLVRGRDALTISDIGTISFVTCFSAERSAFPLSHTSNVRYIAFSLGMGPYLYLAFNENELLTYTLVSKERYFHVTPHPSFDYRASSRRLR